jgi:hypothetical protein
LFSEEPAETPNMGTIKSSWSIWTHTNAINISVKTKGLHVPIKEEKNSHPPKFILLIKFGKGC